MSKIKNQIEKEQENILEYYSQFYDWLDGLRENELGENDLNKMEEDLNKPSTVSNLILSNKALNNKNFNPRYGA